MNDADDRGDAEHQVEADPEIRAHRQRREDDREDCFLLQLFADLWSDRFLIEDVECAEECFLGEESGDAGRHAGRGAHLVHRREEAELGALVDDVLGNGRVVLLRIFIRSLVIGIGGEEEIADAVASVEVEIELARCSFRIEIVIELRDRLSGVVAFTLLLRQADEHRVLIGFAVLLDRSVGEIGCFVLQCGKTRARAAAGHLDFNIRMRTHVNLGPFLGENDQRIGAFNGDIGGACGD